MMIEFEPYQISLIASFILAIIELASFSFIFLSMALGMLTVAFCQYVTGIDSINRDLMVFTIASIGSALVINYFNQEKKLSRYDEHEDVNRY